MIQQPPRAPKRLAVVAREAALETLRAGFWTGVIGGVLFGSAVVGAAIWSLVVEQRAESTADVLAQGQLLLGLTNMALTVGLVIATGYYAVQSRHLVRETRRARQADEAARAQREREERDAKREGAVAALVGATTDMAALGSTLAVVVRLRFVWRLSRAEAAMQPVMAASRALDRLRYLDPVLATAGEPVFDSVLAYFEAAVAGARDLELNALAHRMYKSKTALLEAVAREAVECGGRSLKLDKAGDRPPEESQAESAQSVSIRHEAAPVERPD